MTDAAVREAHEEIGIEVDPDSLGLVHVMYRRDELGRGWVNFFLLARLWDGDPTVCEPDKCDGLLWVDYRTGLPPETIPYVAFAIESLGSGEWFSETGWGHEF